MAAPTTTYRMWKRLAERPGGTRLFSAAAMVRVRVFRVHRTACGVRMEPGFAEVAAPKWFFVKSVEVVRHPIWAVRADVAVANATMRDLVS